ncbi:MAG: hypothetical protein ACP5U2_02915 [Bryobacteraceae bacterium]
MADAAQFSHAGGDRLRGFAGGDVALSPRELEVVISAVKLAGAAPAVVTGVSHGDWLVAAAARLQGAGDAAWVLKRIGGSAERSGRRLRLWYGALATAALLGIGAVTGSWLAVRSGVARIRAGLERLEDDFDYRLPAIGGEFGEIAQAVNRMAERRRVLEQELRRQERLAALGKVVAGVAHEIRTAIR